MVAAPLVQGAGAGAAAVAAAAHTAAMLLGAAATASLLVAVNRALGAMPAAAVATICACSAAAIALQAVLHLRMAPPGSRWMVPRQWARFGTTAYAACFGFALGTGVMTLLPSAALYALLALAESAPRWWQSYVIMVTFAAARGVMVPLLTTRSIRRGLHPSVGGDRLRDNMARLGVVETVLLAALAMELLLG